jgi:FG-GAP repeat protein
MNSSLRIIPALTLVLAAGAARGQCDAPRLISPAPGDSDQFATAAAIEGATVVIGSPYTAAPGAVDRGRVDIYTRIFGWNHQATLVPEATGNFQFGRSVAISGDWAVVGAPLYPLGLNGGEGAAFFYHRVNGVWTKTSTIGPAPDGIGNDHTGISVAIDGDYAIIGAPDASPFSATRMGLARVAVRVGSTWNQVADIHGPGLGLIGGNAGRAVGVRGSLFMLSAPGASVSGLPGAGMVCLTAPGSGDLWYTDVDLHATDPQQDARMGESAAMGDSIVVAGAPNYDIGNVPDAGAVYIFTKNGLGIWIQTAQLLPPAATPLAHFGQRVELDGNRLVITEPGTGKVYIYRKTNLGGWVQEWRLHDPYELGQGFGFGVAISGDRVVVGSPLGEVQNLTSAGWAHVFELDAGNGADAPVFAPAATIGTTTGCTTMATNDGSTTCGSSNSRPDVWYRFTAPCDGQYTFDTAGSDFDTVLSLHSAGFGGPGASFACSDNVGFLTHSFIQTPLAAGQASYIRVSGNTQNGGGFTLRITGCGTCDANCDGSSIAPILNVNDFICFQTKFAAGDPYANCDGSTIQPVLNVNDFICFQTKYAQGCP